MHIIFTLFELYAVQDTRNRKKKNCCSAIAIDCDIRDKCRTLRETHTLDTCGISSWVYLSIRVKLASQSSNL